MWALVDENGTIYSQNASKENLILSIDPTGQIPLRQIYRLKDGSKLKITIVKEVEAWFNRKWQSRQVKPRQSFYKKPKILTKKVVLTLKLQKS